MKSGLVDAGDAQLWVTDTGSGPALVLLHGIIASSWCWRQLIPMLSQSHRVIAIDSIAHGKSRRVLSADHSLAGYTRRTLTVCRNLGIDRATWIGTSYGGAVAMQAVIEDPTAVEKLVMMAPAHPFAESAMELARWYGTPLGTLAAHLYIHVPKRTFQWAMGRMFAEPSLCTAEMASHYFAPLKIRHTIASILSCLKSYGADMRNLQTSLPQLKTLPVRFIWGDCDPVVPHNSAARLMQELDDVRLYTMKHVGHLPYEEQPQAFEKLLLKALAE